MNDRCSIKIFNDCLPLFEMLRDEQRQNILLNLVKNKEMTVGEIVEVSNLSMPAISHHLKLLSQAGVVSARKEGTKKIYSAQLEDVITLLKQLTTALEMEVGINNEEKNINSFD